MINTYNESKLHATLKKLYALEYNGKTEIPIQNWICDIVYAEKKVIEIQTKNVSKLAKKTEDLLSNGFTVTIVHPVIISKTIETYSKKGIFLKKRKSPRTETIYSIFRDLTGIYHLLTKKNFTLEIIFIEITETRQQTDTPTQLINKSRRFLKNWIPLEKRLNSILKKKYFKNKEDYLSLIPPSLSESFSTPELSKAISMLPEITNLNKSSRMNAEKQARLLIWLYTHMNLLEECGKKGRSKLYKISK